MQEKEAIKKWDELARSIGYKNHKTMLRAMYVKRGISTGIISYHLGYCKAAVRQRLQKIGITLRPRGGKNHCIREKAES